MNDDALLGKHWIHSLSRCNPLLLDDAEYIEDLLEAAAVQAGMTVLHKASHQFDPQGVTAFVMLAESHISIHTWPEKMEAALDVFTCGESDGKVAVDFIVLGLSGMTLTSDFIARWGEQYLGEEDIDVTYLP